MVLLCYLSVILPLRACFAVDLEPGDTAFLFEVFVDVVFVTDLVFNFRTAYMTPAGVLEVRRLSFLVQFFLKPFKDVTSTETSARDQMKGDLS